MQQKRVSFAGDSWNERIVDYVNYTIPCSTMDLATFINPAMFAPFM